MASKETIVNKSDAFFQGVSSGSVDELNKILVDYAPKEITAIVNSVNSEGETPLLVAIKEDHYGMAAFLVKELKADINRFGRFTLKGLDYAEVPPLFAAFMSYHNYDPNHDWLWFLILTEEKFDDKNMSQWRVLLNSISSSLLLTRNQKIEILELLGAAYCMKHSIGNLILAGRYKIAYIFWLESLRLRSADQPYIRKAPQHLSAASRKVFGNVSEFTTEEELEKIFTALQNNTVTKNPTRFYVETQALLMIHRIMSELQLDPHPFFLNNLLNYGSYWFEHQYDRQADILFCITASLRAVNGMFRFEWSWDIFQNVLEHTEFNQQHIPFSIVMEILRRFSDFHSKWLGCKFNQRSLENALRHVISLVEQIHDSLLNETETVEFKQWLSQYMLMMNGHSGVYSPLHFVCGDGLIRFGALHRIPVIQLLLEAGANPMATNHNGNSPLLLLLCHRRKFRDINSHNHLWTAVQLLLNFGAHLDQPNAHGETPLKIFKEKQLNLEKEGRPDPYIDSICNTFFPLPCLCAQVIGQHGIPYNDLPLVLRTFIQNHKRPKIN